MVVVLALTELNCNYCGLKTLDVSGCGKQLRSLWLSNNNFKTNRSVLTTLFTSLSDKNVNHEKRIRIKNPYGDGTPISNTDKELLEQKRWTVIEKY